MGDDREETNLNLRHEQSNLCPLVFPLHTPHVVKCPLFSQTGSVCRCRAFDYVLSIQFHPQACCEAANLPQARCEAARLPQARCEAAHLPQVRCEAAPLPQVRSDAAPLPQVRCEAAP